MQFGTESNHSLTSLSKNVPVVLPKFCAWKGPAEPRVLCDLQSLRLPLRQHWAAQEFSRVFYSLMEAEIADIFLGITQKSEVCKTLANLFLVGEVQLC